ncbi:natural killer cells antigen CD94-like [Talpa occidentalis]|uniref:natural killer cells antigen CD94-like n=1 Tax=Talpa occidentalis TaxID=50954 RepID=UPI0023F6E9BE|nr:natural killer cells antigen CD94-like [Talpa occidentalis]
MIRHGASRTRESSQHRAGAPLFMTAFQTILWRWISGILGVTCLLLMATLGIVLKNYYGYSSCQERWVGYQCNCYFISSELKMWNESSDICANHNSTLLQMNNRDELHFMKRNPYFYWIGVIYNTNRSAWVWLDGSAVPQDLFPFPQTENTKNCIAYRSNGDVVYEPCETKNSFICKQLT